jgi:hypothetical protein
VDIILLSGLITTIHQRAVSGLRIDISEVLQTLKMIAGNGLA